MNVKQGYTWGTMVKWGWIDLIVYCWFWIYSIQIKKRDTLVCILYTVNCQLSTVNCQLSTVTFLTHPEMSPGCLHTICQSMSGKILFKNIFKNIIIFLARDLGQFHDISWHWIMTGQNLSWMNENVEIFISNFPHNLPQIWSWKLKIRITRHLCTCHLSPVTWHLSTSHSATSCETRQLSLLVDGPHVRLVALPILHT